MVEIVARYGMATNSDNILVKDILSRYNVVTDYDKTLVRTTTSKSFTCSQVTRR